MSGGEADLRQRDEEARALARREFERPVVLEAGAGTGKTATLVARVLVWAIGPGWERAMEARTDARHEEIAATVLDRITAITFTERAAVEMKQRVAAAIEKIVRGRAVVGLPESDLPDRARRDARARALLVEIDRLHVETIHAFCRRLLADHALAAGIHPGFEVDAEGELLEAEVEALLADFVYECYGDGPDRDALALLEQGIGPGEIGEALRLILNSDCPAARLTLDPYPAEDVASFRAAILAEMRPLLALAEAPIRGGKGQRKKALELLDALESALPEIEKATEAEALADAIAEFDRDGRGSKLRDWAKEGPGKTESGLLGDELATEVESRAGRLLAALDSVAAWKPRLLRPAFRLLSRLVIRLEQAMHRRGALTFADLLRRARDLLRARPDIRAQLRSRTDQLLVDEVQDTDPIQYEIVRMIALEGENRPGLFLVGDPKQSIYAFRSADLAAFSDFVAEVVAEGGRRMPLAVNFRSDPPILAEVERLLPPIMREAPGLQPAFEPLLAAPNRLEGRGFEGGGRRPVEYWNSWRRDPASAKLGAETGADDARVIEAEAIAADMRALHEEEGVAYREMAILLRATTQQETYLRALRDAGVPYLVERDKQFYRRREVIDAGSLLVSVLDPHDQVALLGFLRSPAVGLPDAALLPLWRRGFPDRLAGRLGPEEIAELDGMIDEAAAAMPAGLAELAPIANWPALLKYALRALADLRRGADELPADLFVDRLRRAFGLESQEAARFLGGHRLANLDRFFREVQRRLGDPERSRREILREILVGIAEEKDEAEGSPGDQTTDAVRVMSIHKAKGLDFDQVYLAALHQGPGGGARPDGIRQRGDRFELRLFGAATPRFAELEAEAERIGAAEAVRTLYVAVTRAARRLVLSGKWPADDADLKAPEDAKATIDLVRRRGSVPSWSALDAGGAGEEQRLLDDDGVLWRLPDHAGRRGPRVARTRPDEDPVAALAGLEGLAELREAKAERENVPALRRASEAKEDPADEDEAIDLELPRVLTRVPPDEAALFGTALHRLLEYWPLESALADHLGRIAADVGAFLAPAEAALFGPAFAASLDRLTVSKSVARLDQLARAGAILARELPIVLQDGESVVVGTIDLLYEEAGRLVVADFKTDRIEGGVEECVAAHAAQGRLYERAVREAFRESKEVRFELWFLDADLVVGID